MVFSASEKTFSEKTDHVVQDNGELKRVGVYTLPGQPEKGVRTRGRQGEWTRNLLLAALISPSLGTIGGEDSICETRARTKAMARIVVGITRQGKAGLSTV